MNSLQRLLAVGFVATLSLLFGRLASAQQPVDVDLQASSTSGTTQTPTPTPSSTPSQTSAAMEEGGWHFEIAPYLWFAGAHGTVGALGRDVSIHASPGDLLSHFDIGLMGAAEARRNRFLLNGDLMWIRISDSRALPFPNLSAVSANVTLGELVWTSKVGYRVIDQKKIKADANVGARFWHMGQKLNFNPSALGLNFNGSLNWTDIVIGGRVQLPMGEKTVIDLLGDVGGWGATAKLDYQFAAILGYKVARKWTLVAGYRYLFIDYRPTNLSIINMVTSGALIGVTYRLK
jgi:hypothetical protein